MRNLTSSLGFLTHSFLFITLFLFLSSCSFKKEIVYFQNTQNIQEAVAYSNTTIQKNDILEIRVFSPDPKISALFINSTVPTGAGNIENKKLDGYLVDELGNISIPILGEVNVLGLSTTKAKKKIEELLLAFVLDPIVQLRLVNYKITVLGEVKNPGTFTLFEERLTIPQALGLAGDLTINGKRDKVLLIRHDGNTNSTISLDLTKDDIIASPYYYLNQNDIIYVEPNQQKIKSSGLIGRTGELTSVLSLALSIIILLTR